MIMVVVFFNFMFVILLVDNGNKGCYLYGYYFVSEDLDDYMM